MSENLEAVVARLRRQHPQLDAYIIGLEYKLAAYRAVGPPKELKAFLSAFEDDHTAHEQTDDTSRKVLDTWLALRKAREGER